MKTLFDLPVVDILRVGLPGFCFLLSLMGYLLLRGEQKQERPRTSMLKSIKGFNWTSFTVAVLVAVSSLVEASSLTEAAGQRAIVGQEQRFLVLQNTGSHDLNSAELPDGSTVRLMNVDSLSDDRLVTVLNDLRESILHGDSAEGDEADGQLEKFYLELTEYFGFGARHEAALDLFQAFLGGAPDVDERWEQLVNDIAKQRSDPQDFIQRIREEPFAIVQVGEKGGSRLALALPDRQLQIGDHSYAVPVIANPALEISRGITEAIVIEMY